MSNEPLLAFLIGAAPLDGVWFGERHPTEKGLFWWRKHLQAAVEDDTALLRQALEVMEKSRVFVTTREKIKHPEGTEWYDETITALRERLGEKT